MVYPGCESLESQPYSVKREGEFYYDANSSTSSEWVGPVYSESLESDKHDKTDNEGLSLNGSYLQGRWGNCNFSIKPALS